MFIGWRVSDMSVDSLMILVLISPTELWYGTVGEYLLGVVPSEMIAGSWHMEALRAQAVAARQAKIEQLRQKAKERRITVADLNDVVLAVLGDTTNVSIA